MPTVLHLLPARTAGAAENMAVDFLLLQRYPATDAARFRHYGWRTEAFTFGYGQKMEFVRATLPPGENFDLCRRPTGGGIVDHRHDWTYALVIPRGHELYDKPAPESYRLIHEELAQALVALGQPVKVQPEAPPGDPGPTICFVRAERFDVVHAQTGAKVAGAAQKRNKQGLLFQGSIEKETLDEIDWDDFQAKFTAGIARALRAEPREVPWPDLNEDEVGGLVEQYSSPEWLEHR